MVRTVSLPARRLRRATVLVLLALGAFSVRSASGQEAAGAYRTPPKILVDLADAPRAPQVMLDPTRQWMLVLAPEGLPPIADLSQRELRLAGLRINPRIDGQSRRLYATGMKLVRLADLEERAVAGLPAGRIGNVSWSPDGRHAAFTLTGDDKIELYALDVATARVARVSDARLSLTWSGSPQWLADSRSLLCALVPEGRGAEPAPPPVPPGPVEQETAGRAAPARTYQDLLKDTYDEALFDHYLTVQLARIDLDGKVVPLGSPGLRRAASSPDGRYLLVETLHRPYSYLVPLERFPRRFEVWDASGAPVREIADLPLREEVSIAFDSVPAGPRALNWRADAPATLAWVEALDGGDSRKPAELRDRVQQLAAPFAGPPRVLADLGYRLEGVTWGNGDLALVTEAWWKTRRTRTWIVRPDAPAGTAPELLFDRSSEDRYGDPGEPLTAPNAYDRRVLVTAGSTLFLAGSGASPEGERPFLDALDLGGKGAKSGAAHATRRLFRSAAPYYEQPVELLDAGRTLLLRRESVAEPPNYFVRDLKSGALRQLTAFPNPAPQLASVHKEVIHYRRADGVALSATLYLPPGYRHADGPLPLLLWAYPQEFKSADAAGQVTPSPYRFEQIVWYSPVIWVLRGYAVLDNPGMPIVGAGKEEPNDTYVQQLVADATAAVDEVVRRGVAERGKIAVGGHSYGAFMAANLLAHSHLFAAGIAVSGAYNRTLTPFGFQAEERTLWQAPSVYTEMSPFQHADQVAAPILLVHGQADNNPGTDPIQSERFYNAIKGLGGTARLVLLPYESHTCRARESVLHLLWETDRWLDRYVKQGAPTASGSAPSAPRPASPTPSPSPAAPSSPAHPPAARRSRGRAFVLSGDSPWSQPGRLSRGWVLSFGGTFSSWGTCSPRPRRPSWSGSRWPTMLITAASFSSIDKTASPTICPWTRRV